MVFKKWVDYLLKFNGFIALFLIATFEFENLITQLIVGLICIAVIFVNGILLSAFGR